MSADSAEAVEQELPEETDVGESFNMDGAVEELSRDIFGKSEPEEEVDDEELAELSKEEAKTKEPEKEAPEKEEAKREPPQSWKKETHEIWDSIPDAAKDYIEKREEQMRAGLEKDRTDANLGRTMRDVMTPHAQLLKQQGVDEPTAVKYMLNAHYNLSNGTPEQRLKYFKEFAQSYGFNDNNGKEVDPTIQELRNEIHTIKSNLTATQQRTVNEMRSKIESTVDAFAEEHPHFHDLEDDIAKFITAGYELEDAYEKALWANPSTRQLELDRINKETSEKTLAEKKEAADKAKKAKSVNVRGRDTGKAPTAPKGTMEDTLRETFRDIKNRN